MKYQNRNCKKTQSQKL